MQNLNLEQLEVSFKKEIAQVETLLQLQKLKSTYLGPKSEIKLALRSIKEMPPESRRAFATRANQLHELMTQKLAEIEEQLHAQMVQQAVQQEWLDVSLPDTAEPLGLMHPVSQVERLCLQYLFQLGFDLVEGPEIETDYY